ncbi:hypothetical protein Tco_1214398 [Tanacetum coccineum]
MKVEEESRANNDDEIQENRECFDEHESMEDKNDDIGDLCDYLILNEGPYYVNEEEERSKERSACQETTRNVISNFVIESIFPSCRYGVSNSMDMTY